MLCRQKIAVRPGGKEFELSTPDDYHIQGLVISHDILKKHSVVLQNPERLMNLLSENPAVGVNPFKKRRSGSISAMPSGTPKLSRNATVPSAVS